MRNRKSEFSATKAPPAMLLALAVMCAVIATLGTACRRELPVSPGQYVSPESYSVEVHDGYTVTDEARGREFPVRVRYPADAPGPLPVVIFSHGAGALENGHLIYQEWGARLASAGYAVVHIAHVEGGQANHCMPLEIPPGECRPLSLLTGDTLPEVWYNPPRDVTATIDELEAIGLATGIDLDSERIALVGHSGGAHTVMSASGAAIDFSASVKSVTYLESRVKAFVANSPQGPGALGFSEMSWDGIEAPMLIATGAADTGPATPDPTTRRIPFQRMSGPGKYELFIDSPDAIHSVFGLGSEVGLGERPLTQMETYVLSSALAFLDAYVRDLPEAREWLTSGNIEAWSDGEAMITAK